MCPAVSSSNGLKNVNNVISNNNVGCNLIGPGASDDAASCVVMLEILRVFSKSSTRNRHSIIFLFNGAEETGLQAAHGFITQHKWAKDIKGKAVFVFISKNKNYVFKFKQLLLIWNLWARVAKNCCFKAHPITPGW